ncbi:MAG: LptF/LptG family permease [Alistipes sp.]|nr:LptF/LptG family permease [Candidatus Alistipes equi]
MKKIHRLVLTSYLGPMILTFFIIIFILMMNFVWRYIDDLVGKGLEAGVIIELIMYATVNMIQMGLPLAILLATIMTMGNLGENYELLAMKSAGMSLMRIISPLIAVVGLISIGSFFIINNLVPYSNNRMFTIIRDIKQQNQALVFQDGLFFNGIDDMSIRVEHQDPDTHLLTNVLIYDNRSVGGNMTTTLADSGYIRLSDDKRFLLVTLYSGHTYEQTRNSQWYNKSTLRHHTFLRQDGKIPVDGFDFERSDDNLYAGNAQTQNINELQHSIDSLELKLNELTTSSYKPLMAEHLFVKDAYAVIKKDSLYTDRSEKKYDALLVDSVVNLSVREKNRLYQAAVTSARTAQSSFSFDENTSKEVLNQLYRSRNEWHRKLALPVSILIFFLVGAPLGAIIRKGGLGMPIVISVIFFVIYYIISISGEKYAKEGTWSSTLGMWISTIILTPLAVYLTYKATNDSALLDFDWYKGRYEYYKLKFESKLPYSWQQRLSIMRVRREEFHRSLRLSRGVQMASNLRKKILRRNKTEQ